MFQFLQSQQVTISSQIPGPGFQGVEITALPGCQLVSVGFQNSGLLTNVWASQMFIYQGGVTALIQLVNGSLTSTANVWVYWVQASSSDTISGEPSLAEVNLLPTST